MSKYEFLMKLRGRLTVDAETVEAAEEMRLGVIETEIDGATLDGLLLSGLTVQESGATAMASAGDGQFGCYVDLQAVVYVETDTEAEARARFSALKAEGVKAFRYRSVLVSDFSRAPLVGDELLAIDGVDIDDLCCNSDCREPTNDGEGWDGKCGDCADKVVRQRGGGGVTTIETVEREGYRVRIELDPSPTNPRIGQDNAVHALTIDTHLGSYVEVDSTGGPLEAAWKRLAWNRWRGVETFERYARIYHGATVVEHRPINGAASLWYLTAADIARHEINDPKATIKAEIEEYQAWADGEVYGYAVERRVTWQRVDLPAGQEEHHWTWDWVDGQWGLGGLEYARTAAHAALSQAIAGQWGARW